MDTGSVDKQNNTNAADNGNSVITMSIGACICISKDEKKKVYLEAALRYIRMNDPATMQCVHVVLWPPFPQTHHQKWSSEKMQIWVGDNHRC